MFTGIIEDIGIVKGISHGASSAILTIYSSKIMGDVKIGDSIAVNGVCLTARTIKGNEFTADVMAETLRRSSLGSLKVGSKVNLERAMLAGGRFGGHIVSGHIDGTGVIKSFKEEDNAVWVEIGADKKILRFIIEKGSIAIDGISLTVAYVDEKVFKVSVIPHTASETTLLSKKTGDIVNLENDVIGKYVEKLLTHSDTEVISGDDSHGNSHAEEKKSGLTMETLLGSGFL